MFYIPEVSQGTIDSTLASMLDDETFMSKVVEDIKVNNPVLFSLIETVSDSRKSDAYITGYVVGTTQFYALISRQSEADMLNKQNH